MPRDSGSKLVTWSPVQGARTTHRAATPHSLWFLTCWFRCPVTTQQGPQAARPIHGPPEHAHTHTRTHGHAQHILPWRAEDPLIPSALQGTHVATLITGNPPGPPSKPCPPRAGVCTVSPTWQASRSASALCTQTPQTLTDRPCVCTAPWGRGCLLEGLRGSRVPSQGPHSPPLPTCNPSGMLGVATSSTP